jgi:hypothetical protein
LRLVLLFPLESVAMACNAWPTASLVIVSMIRTSHISRILQVHVLLVLEVCNRRLR